MLGIHKQNIVSICVLLNASTRKDTMLNRESADVAGGEGWQLWILFLLKMYRREVQTLLKEIGPIALAIGPILLFAII